MSEAPPAVDKAAEESKSGGVSRARVVAARALTVLAVLLGLVGMLAYYVAHTALDESGFEKEKTKIAENIERMMKEAAFQQWLKERRGLAGLTERKERG